MSKENEQEIREHVKALKEYYTNVAIYAAIVVACIIIWLSTGGGFWPIWVIFALSISTIMQGIRLGVFPMIPDFLPFLKADWEEQQVKSRLESPIQDDTKQKPNKPKQDQ